MAKRATQRADLKAVPLLLNESLYVGIDIGKGKHLAGFLSKALLERHERFEACPALVFENLRRGFGLFLNGNGRIGHWDQLYHQRRHSLTCHATVHIT